MHTQKGPRTLKCAHTKKNVGLEEIRKLKIARDEVSALTKTTARAEMSLHIKMTARTEMSAHIKMIACAEIGTRIETKA